MSLTYLIQAVAYCQQVGGPLGGQKLGSFPLSQAKAEEWEYRCYMIGLHDKQNIPVGWGA